MTFCGINSLHGKYNEINVIKDLIRLLESWQMNTNKTNKMRYYAQVLIEVLAESDKEALVNYGVINNAIKKIPNTDMVQLQHINRMHKMEVKSLYNHEKE